MADDGGWCSRYGEKKSRAFSRSFASMFFSASRGLPAPDQCGDTSAGNKRHHAHAQTEIDRLRERESTIGAAARGVADCSDEEQVQARVNK